MRPSSCPLELTVNLRHRQKRGGEKEGRDSKERALCKEREKKKKGEGKERVVLIRLRPTRMRADAGKEPDTRRDTRTLVHCGILPSCISLGQITAQKSAHTHCKRIPSKHIGLVTTCRHFPRGNSVCIDTCCCSANRK